MAGIGVALDKSWSGKETTELNKRNKDWDCAIRSVGGYTNGTTINISEQGGTSFNISLGTWANSITDATSKLVDVNWDGVIPIYEFVSDTTKKNLLKAVV